VREEGMVKVFFAGAVACALLVSTQPAAGCSGELPESVVDCYTAAYAQRDIAAIEALYADDYVWVDVMPLRAQVWDRATALESAGNMFAHPGEPSISLTLEGPFKVVPEDAGKTWRIEGIDMSLVIAFPGAADPDTARGCATFYVRQVDGKPGAFEIYREVTFGNGDCARWSEGAQPD
jgi:hypothetical protein